MKHLEINKKCDRKSCFLARSKTLFIENNNFTKLRKGYKKREICSYPFSLSFFLFILFFFFYPFWFLLVLLALFGQGRFFFINLLSKAMIVCSRISMQSLSMMLNMCPGLTTVIHFITQLEAFRQPKGELWAFD